MATANLTTIRKYKKQHCKGVKGSYAKMRSACKRYVEAQVRKAAKGNKTKTRTSARKTALRIVKGGCSR